MQNTRITYLKVVEIVAKKVFFLSEAYLVQQEDEPVLTTMNLNKKDLGFEILVRTETICCSVLVYQYFYYHSINPQKNCNYL